MTLTNALARHLPALATSVATPTACPESIHARTLSVIPAKAGIHGWAKRKSWIPAFAGMTAVVAGMTAVVAGMTAVVAGMTMS